MMKSIKVTVDTVEAGRLMDAMVKARCVMETVDPAVVPSFMAWARSELCKRIVVNRPSTVQPA